MPLLVQLRLAALAAASLAKDRRIAVHVPLETLSGRIGPEGPLLSLPLFPLLALLGGVPRTESPDGGPHGDPDGSADEGPRDHSPDGTRKSLALPLLPLLALLFLGGGRRLLRGWNVEVVDGSLRPGLGCGIPLSDGRPPCPLGLLEALRDLGFSLLSDGRHGTVLRGVNLASLGVFFVFFDVVRFFARIEKRRK